MSLLLFSSRRVCSSQRKISRLTCNSLSVLFQFSLNGISLGKCMLIWTVLSGDNQKEIGKKYVHKSEFNKQPLALSVSSVDAVGCRDPCCKEWEQQNARVKMEKPSNRTLHSVTAIVVRECRNPPGQKSKHEGNSDWLIHRVKCALPLRWTSVFLFPYKLAKGLGLGHARTHTDWNTSRMKQCVWMNVECQEMQI